jgi:predicted DNA-binding protein
MTEDVMIRVPKDLRIRYDKLSKRNSWKGFPSFVREAIRSYLEHYELLDKE